jgi:two-component system chemotaxis response regulator CheY
VSEILLIDDMAGVRRAVVAMLKRAGHIVTAAERGGEGLELLKARRFDLVITDMLMPGTDGADVLSCLDTLPNRPPVIAISGGGAGLSADSALRLARIKADAFLEKPFDSDELLETVEKLLTMRV